MFLPGFLLLTQPSSYVPVEIKCNKEDLKIVSSLNQDDDNQISDILLLIWECDKVDRRVEKGNKELWYCGFYGNEYNIWSYIEPLMNLTRSGVHIINRYRGKILPKYQRQFKELKENKEVSRNQGVANRVMLQTLVHSDAEAISTYLLSRERRKVSGISSDNYIGLGTQLRRTTKGKVMNHLMFQVRF